MQIPSTPPPGLTLTLQPLAQAAPSQNTGLGLSLRPYQIVQASVVKGGLDKAELELGRHRFQALSKVPLSTGQRIQAQVMSTSPYIELRLMDRNALMLMFSSLHHMGQAFDLGGILSRIALNQSFFGQGWAQSLRQVLGRSAELLPSNGQQLSGKILASLTRFLGLDMERQIMRNNPDQAAARLKSALLALSRDQGQEQEVRQQAQRLVSHLELFQFCRIRMWEQGLNWLPLPLPFLKQGYLLWERGRGGADQEGDYKGQNLRLVLEMSSLGNLDLGLYYLPPGLKVIIGCESPEVAAVLESAQADFIRSITALPVLDCKVVLGADDPAQILLRLAVDDKEQVFQVRV